MGFHQLNLPLIYPLDHQQYFLLNLQQTPPRKLLQRLPLHVVMGNPSIRIAAIDSCQWLASSNSRLKYCTKWVNWGKYNGVVYGPPGFVCRETCKSCDPCFQHNKAKFYFKQKKGKVVVKNCTWLKKNKKKSDICAKGKTDGVYPPAHEVCPVTCGIGTC